MGNGLHRGDSSSGPTMAGINGYWPPQGRQQLWIMEEINGHWETAALDFASVVLVISN